VRREEGIRRTTRRDAGWGAGTHRRRPTSLPRVEQNTLKPRIAPQDAHWAHTPGAWLFDMAMLTVLCLVYGSFVRWKLRLKAA
jgi:hypothetical protein